MAPAAVTETAAGSDQGALHGGNGSGTGTASHDAGPVGALAGRWHTVAVVLVVLAVALGLVLRFWTKSALWLDEALTVDIARLPLRDLHQALKRDGAPPLFYVLLHFWMRVFGQSDLAVRSLAGVLSVATLPVAWLAGRRYGGRTVAWATLLLLVSSPFAVYYATEARMYSLVMFLTACGLVALDRAMARPRAGNLVALAVVVGALLYTQYWALYLTGTLGLWLLYRAFLGHPERRRSARFALGAVVVGALTFVPWLPTFVFQTRYTGTPWAPPVNLGAVISAITGFTDNQASLANPVNDQGRLLVLFYGGLMILGLFGVAKDRWHTELDLHTQPRGRFTAWIVVGTLVAAVAGGIVSQSAFSQRYASVVFVPLVLLLALGVAAVGSAELRAIVLLVAVVTGFACAVLNVSTQRSQAPAVAAVLRADAKPGDVVTFCPDQLGPATARLLPADEYRMLTYPRATSPEFVDWVNYLKVADRSDPKTFARRLVRLAGPHTIWAVWAPGYAGFETSCDQLATDLSTTPGYREVQRVALDPGEYYEPMYLWEFRRAS